MCAIAGCNNDRNSIFSDMCSRHVYFRNKLYFDDLERARHVSPLTYSFLLKTIHKNITG